MATEKQETDIVAVAFERLFYRVFFISFLSDVYRSGGEDVAQKILDDHVAMWKRVIHGMINEKAATREDMLGMIPDDSKFREYFDKATPDGEDLRLIAAKAIPGALKEIKTTFATVRNNWKER